ncbi:non-ribosomal peptide synthetase [Burkholderia ubonensis]|nr:non-ribosomal peptide synthetase [Burkholderia ubonensis]
MSEILEPAQSPADAMSQPWPAPATESQLGLVVLHEAIPVPHLYNVVVELRIDPRLPASRLRQALADLLAVQPALRLALHGPVATLIEPPAPDDLPLIGITAQHAFYTELNAALESLKRTAFSLERPPLLKMAHIVDAEQRDAALVLVIHHLIFDGASISPLIRDLDAALSSTLDIPALRGTRELALSRELHAQARAAHDPAVDQRARAIGDRLRDVPATALFPRPGRTVSTIFDGRRIRIEPSPERTTAIDRTLAALGVTPFVFFSGLFAALLARHGGVHPVTFGTPLVARRTLASHALCGFFVNTLPLTLDVDWQQRFDAFLTTTVASATDQVKREVAVPFGRVVQHAAPARDGNRNPLFSAMLAMQDTTAVPADSAIRSVREHGTETAKFDLWLGVTPTPDGWLLELEYDTALLPDAIAQGLCASLTHALDTASAAPTTPLAELFRDHTPEYARRDDGLYCPPAAPDLDAWLRAAAAAHGERVAVEEPGKQLTYGALQRRVARAAAGLRERGVSVGDVVGLSTDTLVDTIIAMLAILRLRAIFLPLDLSLPRERLAYMTDKAQCRIAIGAGEPGIPIVALDMLDGSPVEATDGRTPDDGVYVMFTSGSTGKPKGVLMHNAPLVNLTAWQVAALQLDARTRFLQYAPLGFDVSFQEIIPTLATGGTVISRGGLDRRDLAAIAAHVRDAAVTHVYLPVAALRPFVLAAARMDLRSLRYLCVSGDQLIADDEIRTFLAERPAVQLVNLYGPTETHAVTTHRLDASAADWSAHAPIGLPIAGVDAQVVDGTGHLAPLGVAGELFLGGACPATGYIHDPERTAERFVPDPHAPGRFRYRTGDQVLRDERGVLIFLGRNDHQIKIRGYRIEPGEIEARLLAHPGVKEAVVVAVGEGQARRLVAYLVAAPDTSLADALRTRLARELPDYMVPAAFIRLDALPVTPNGKFDRKALPAPDADAFARHAYEAPADETERTLAALWRDVLEVDRIGRRDSFFELGGHSLLAIRVVAQAAAYGATLSLNDLFRFPVLADLAAHLAREAAATRSVAAVPIRRAGAGAPVFFVPSGWGDYSYAFSLAPSLDVDAPVHALPWPRLDDQASPPTLEAIAAALLPAVDAVAARGPLRLLGYSAGGALAHALAAALSARGDAVTFLGLIDCEMPAVDPIDAADPFVFFESVTGRADARQADAVAQLRHRLGHADLTGMIAAARDLRLLPADTDLDAEVRRWLPIIDYASRVRAYRAAALPLVLHQFHATEPLPFAGEGAIAPEADPSLGWRAVQPAQRLRTIALPGNHYTMIEAPANRDALGRAIGAALRASPPARE